MNEADKMLFYQDSAGVLKTITFENFAAAIVDATAGTGLSAVSNIAGLEDFTTTTLITGSQLSVAGYYTPGDGGGGIFYYDSTSTATPNGGTIFSPNGGVGRWFRILQGRAISVKYFGAKGDGTTDDTTALQAAFTAMRAAAPNISLSFDPGIYQCGSTLLVEGNQVKIIGNNAKIRAFQAIGGGAVLKVGDGLAGAAIEFLVVNDLYVDANGNADFGIYIVESQNISFSNVTANTGTTAAWYIDGSAAGGSLRVINITFTNCFAGSATGNCYGYYFNKNGNTGAFERFLMNGCGAESTYNSIRAVGAFGMQVVGGTFQNSSIASIYCSGSQMTIVGSYFEAGGSTPDLIVDNAATVMCSQTLLSQATVYTDLLSTVGYKDGTSANALGPLISDCNTGRIADRPDSWGNPQWPTGIGGSANAKGMLYTDKMGTEWLCTKPYPDSRWSPRDGYFTIPLSYTDFSNGALWWWAMEDFVMTEMYLVITETFTGAVSYTGFGTYYDQAGGTPFGGDQNLLSFTQCALGNLTAGSVISAKNNVETGNLLGASSNGSVHLAGKGNLPADAFGSSIRQFGDATGWTAGMSYLFVRGFNLKFN